MQSVRSDTIRIRRRICTSATHSPVLKFDLVTRGPAESSTEGGGGVRRRGGEQRRQERQARGTLRRRPYCLPRRRELHRECAGVAFTSSASRCRWSEAKAHLGGCRSRPQEGTSANILGKFGRHSRGMAPPLPPKNKKQNQKDRVNLRVLVQSLTGRKL